MEFKRSVIPSACDGLPLSLLTALPDVKPRALVQLAHGMCEHKERYKPFMSFLASRGYAVVINDHRGHGASLHSPNDLGFFYEAGAGGLVDDLHQVTLFIKSKYPGCKCFLYGHSMGSLAVRAYCNHFDKDIDGLVVSGSPGFNSLAGLGVWLTKALALLPGGERRRSPLITAMSIGSFSKPFPDEPESAWLCKDPKVVEAYQNDPLCGFTFTLNGYRALFALMQKAYARDAKAAHDIPVHFISGSDDSCAPDEEGFKDAVKRFSARGYTHVTSRMYTGLRHELLNEEAGPQIMADLAAKFDDWLR